MVCDDFFDRAFSHSFSTKKTDELPYKIDYLVSNVRASYNLNHDYDPSSLMHFDDKLRETALSMPDAYDYNLRNAKTAS